MERYAHVNSMLTRLAGDLDDNLVQHQVMTPHVVTSHTPFEYVVGEDKTPYEHRCPEFLLKTRLAGYRWLDSNDKVINQPPREYDVYLPLLQKLQQKLPNINFDGAWVDGAMALAFNQTPQLGMGFDKLRESTVRYYIDRSHSKFVQVRNTMDVARKATANGSTVGVCSYEQFWTLPSLGVEWDALGPVCVHDVAVSNFEYDVRQDVKFTKHVHRSEDGDGYECNNVPFKINHSNDFPTFSNLGDGKVRHKTKLLSFHNKATACYGETGYNLISGAKRLIGKREGEEEYRRNGYLLFTMFKDVYQHHTTLLKNERDQRVALKISRGYERRLERNRAWREMLTRLMQDEEYCDVMRSVSTDLSYFIKDRVCLGRMQTLVDTVRTVGSWAYWGAYLVYKQRNPLVHRRKVIADIAHAKRELRTRIVNGEKWSPHSSLLVRELEAKIKNETAKSGKAPRLFVNYGSGCMYSNDLPEYVKVCLDGEYSFEYTHGVTTKIMTVYIFAKPSSPGLREIFKNLYKFRGTKDAMYCVIFSDDQVVFCEDMMFEVDVSSNDAGQGLPTFYATYCMLRQFVGEEAEGLIDQCMLPIIMRNPGDPKEMVEIEFSCPFEGSGSVLTTILNHTGSLINLLCSFHLWARAEASNVEVVERCLRRGAKMNGHDITVTHCTEFEQVTFLKRYGTVVDGEMVVCQCFGSIMKNFGTVDNDMVHTQLGVDITTFNAMPWDERCDRFLGGVVLGLKHESNHACMRALRERFAGTRSIEIEASNSSSKIVSEGQISYTQDTTEGFKRRYNLTQGDIEQFANKVANSRVGKFQSTTVANVVLQVDYGFPEFEALPGPHQPITHY